jgi:Flp pilus assembly protein TadD
MRVSVALVLAAASLSACATAPKAQLVENGYGRGALGVAAIARGDWETAERSIERSRLAENDPARLINLGKVYMETGRPGMALSAWRLALASPNHFMVETVAGQWVSTRDVAERALAKYGKAVRSAAR